MTCSFGDRRDWFPRARFGLFLHWGIYAVEGWHEQQHYRQGMTRDAYRALAQRFDPAGFDPHAWIDLARKCGMGYLVVTAKHIDGFCMFHSAVSDFTVAATPYREDLIGQIATACHNRDLPFGVYFSALDNLHPACPRSGKPHQSPAEPGDAPDYERYMDFVRAQVRELCTSYGELSVFWWDANRTGATDPGINALIRQLQPGCVINNRGWDEGDFGTPERSYGADAEAVAPFERLTEACESVGSQSWGYRVDEDYFTPRYLMRRVDLMMARGANYLLNVGPDARGRIPAEPRRLLQRVGAWYGAVREAFDGATLATDLSVNRDVLLTRRGHTVYVHLNREPATSSVALPPIEALPRRAVLLNTGAPVACDINRLPTLHGQPRTAALRLHDLPVEAHAGEVLVVRLEFGPELDAAPGAGDPADADDATVR